MLGDELAPTQRQAMGILEDVINGLQEFIDQIPIIIVLVDIL